MRPSKHPDLYPFRFALLRRAQDALSGSTLCLHHSFVHGSIHLFVALPISMVQEGLRKRLILPGSQYPDMYSISSLDQFRPCCFMR